MRNRTRDRDRGQAAVELVGWIPLLLLVALAAVQLGLAIFAVQQAGTASRAAARVASQSDYMDVDYETAGRAAMSDWLAQDAEFTAPTAGDAVTVTARVQIPSLLPGVTLGDAERSATMPRD
ncbi:TadE/TadG family type IV pilus assembly protein [Streptomyces sp. AK02-01A]|uniref:TadE/TadG family type IV pilus assembly protein n=1 Tax=Streptomyces sp. AK02-01A TaxID=3028648 RepID=UPI0029A40215|nr:TadE/TadG family type IV pilus assembly protein [Streptomyces sp. AK02-01A]MDX3851676.1 TadE/TadG family type IV pilus assembly protein [Streptomyces sp. AK02-01A]